MVRNEVVSSLSFLHAHTVQQSHVFAPVAFLARLSPSSCLQGTFAVRHCNVSTKDYFCDGEASFLLSLSGVGSFNFTDDLDGRLR